MHRTALAEIHAGLFAEHFGHQTAQVGAFSDRMAVGAMIPDHVIVVAQSHARSDDLAFLADLSMRRAGKLALGLQSYNGLLEYADAQHTPVHFGEPLVVQFHAGPPCGSRASRKTAGRSTRGRP